MPIEMDYVKQAQSYYSKSPTIILGSGASAAHGLSGMGALAEHLIASVETADFDRDETESWSEFTTLLNDKVDLESALHQVRLSPRVNGCIVNATWELLSNEDYQLHRECLLNNNILPLGKLLRLLFRSTATEVQIVTTNYDRIAEYASEQEGIHHYTGFSHGYTRRLVSDTDLRCSRIVKIWKVHGSLDWCRNETGEIIGIGNHPDLPPGFTPLIVTPGDEKYRTTHAAPFRDVISNADSSIANANSYLCIGYGFNDTHIQEKLIERCVRNRASITVIARDLTDSAKTLLLSSGVENYLAIEMAEVASRSRIFSSLETTSFEVDEDYWSLSGYLRLIS